jgi:hypothetical protein
MSDANASLRLHRLRSELDSLGGIQLSDWRVAADALAGFAGRRRSSSKPRRDRPRRRWRRAPWRLVVAIPGAIGLARRRRRAALPAPAVSAPPVSAPVSGATPGGQLTDVTRNFLLGFVLPLWLAAGIADWFCHRRAHIERNAGSTESALHLLMLAEAAVPVIAGLLLEITSPILLLMSAAVVVHAATALWDVSYAVKRRSVTPIEQHVHSYLEMVPLMANAFVAVLHWPELRALLRLGNRRPDWSIRRKRTPLPTGIVVTLLACMLALEVAPYVEEFHRTRRETS